MVTLNILDNSFDYFKSGVDMPDSQLEIVCLVTPIFSAGDFCDKFIFFLSYKYFSLYSLFIFPLFLKLC